MIRSTNCYEFRTQSQYVPPHRHTLYCMNLHRGSNWLSRSGASITAKRLANWIWLSLYYDKVTTYAQLVVLFGRKLLVQYTVTVHCTSTCTCTIWMQKWHSEPGRWPAVLRSWTHWSTIFITIKWEGLHEHLTTSNAACDWGVDRHLYYSQWPSWTARFDTVTTGFCSI